MQLEFPMSNLVFLQTAPDRIAVGSGTFIFNESASPTTASFYVNDFFLTKQKPWIIPSVFEEISLHQFIDKYSLHKDSTPNTNFEWIESDQDKFRKFFHKIKQSIDRRLIEKIVPVIFEHTKIPDELSGDELRVITSRLLPFCKSDLILHGYSIDNHGRCGLTPEILVEYDGKTLVSYALAGTKLSASGDKSLDNPKDIREHQLVVDDLKSVISKFGQVSVGKTAVCRVGSLAHLKATLSAKTNDVVPLEKIIQAIHPTAALGVYPRTPNASIILKSSDTKLPRGEFAAPFGIQYPTGASFCVASIRSCFWNNNQLKIGAGCGIIEESDLESELEELNIKLTSIKNRLNV